MPGLFHGVWPGDVAMTLVTVDRASLGLSLPYSSPFPVGRASLCPAWPCPLRRIGMRRLRSVLWAGHPHARYRYAWPTTCGYADGTRLCRSAIPMPGILHLTAPPHGDAMTTTVPVAKAFLCPASPCPAPRHVASPPQRDAATRGCMWYALLVERASLCPPGLVLGGCGDYRQTL
jgi:hypothetical protein